MIVVYMLPVIATIILLIAAATDKTELALPAFAVMMIYIIICVILRFYEMYGATI